MQRCIRMRVEKLRKLRLSDQLKWSSLPCEGISAVSERVLILSMRRPSLGVKCQKLVELWKFMAVF